MNEKLEAILKILNDKVEDADFIKDREVTRKRYLFLGEIDSENQYMLAVTDICLQDNSIETIKKTIEKAIPFIKDNTNKTVLIKSYLVIELETA